MERIVLKGCRQHNLKNIDLEIPRDKLVVITGLSGSGKSSLAFDTIYAEGQRRYVESLSAAIAIEQKTTSKNPRSTVGTVTEIYDYLRLLYARIGKPYCYKCGREITAQTVQQITDAAMALNAAGNPIHPRRATAAKFDADFRKVIRLAHRLEIDVVINFSGCPGGAPGDRSP